MVHADSPSISFVDALWPAHGASRNVRAILLALLGSTLLTLSAKLQVPFHPVPMTMQTLAVLLIGLAFGAALGATTVLLYLAEGALGLPVFASTWGDLLKVGLAFALALGGAAMVRRRRGA
jgi:biotin transport system substrate-specific component